MSAAPAKKRKLELGPRGQVAVVAVALLVVALAGYLVLVRPKQSEAKALEEQLTAVEAQIAANRQTTPAPPPKKIAFPDLYRMAKAMPDRADMPGILLELNRVAKDTGIVFQSITPGGSEARDGYQVVPVTLVFDGNFYTLSDFLFRLRSLVQVADGKLTASGRLFSVDSIAFAESQRRFPNIQASLTVSAFVYGTGAPAVPPPPVAGTEEEAATTETETVTAPAETEPAPTAAPAGGGS